MFQTESKIEEVIKQPGIWLEIEIDDKTGIYEQGPKYLVTKNNRLISTVTGQDLTSEIESISKITQENRGKYAWQYISMI